MCVGGRGLREQQHTHEACMLLFARVDTQSAMMPASVQTSPHQNGRQAARVEGTPALLAVVSSSPVSMVTEAGRGAVLDGLTAFFL